MQQFSDASDASIIAVDWGFSGFSCIGYLQMNLCVIDKLVDLAVHFFTKCNVNTDTLELLGDSFAGQLIGYIAQKLTSIGKTPSKIFALDPAGVGFSSIRCEGLRNGTAKYTVVFHSNPGEVGTADLSVGDAIFLFNPQNGYVQPNCDPNDRPCNHNDMRRVFLQLSQNKTITGTRLENGLQTPGIMDFTGKHFPHCDGSNEALTIYTEMKKGIYCVDNSNSAYKPLGHCLLVLLLAILIEKF